jgi:hypothetical protein
MLAAQAGKVSAAIFFNKLDDDTTPIRIVDLDQTLLR